MTLTWGDAVTTGVTAAIVVLERAFFHSWSWLSVSSTRWTMAAFALLGGIVFLFNAVSGRVMSAIEYVLGAIGVALVAAGLWTGNSDFLPLVMLNVIALWAVSLGQHAWFTLPEHKHV